MLAREYPALWLPVIFADAAGFALRSSRRAAVFSVTRLTLSMFRGHSVLGGSTGLEHRPTVETLAYIAGGLIGFLLESAQIVLYVIALFVTARMVWERIALQMPDERPRADGAMVAFSIRVMLVGVGLWIAGSVLLWAAMSTRWHALMQWWVVSVLISAVTMSMSAYVIVPPALRLLADPMKLPDKRSIRLGRKCAVAAVIASAGLMILAHIAIGITYGSHAEILGIGAIASVTVALPYVPLYIALSLLARNEQTEVPQEHTVLVPSVS